MDPLELRRTFIRNEDADESIVGTTWLTAGATLGSVNRSMLWTQRRTLIGYWTTDAEPVVVFRQRFLHDGQDFASMGVRNDQSGERVLSLFEPLRNRGSWHPTLDRPANGVFTAEDFRVRYELVGRGVAAEKLDEQRFVLRAGDRRVVIHVLPGRFAGQDVRWVCQTNGTRAVVDGICHAGPPRDFNFKTLDDVILVTGLELLADGQQEVSGPSLVETGSKPNEAAWKIVDRVLRVSR
jgi:hypothetical protein